MKSGGSSSAIGSAPGSAGTGLCEIAVEGKAAFGDESAIVSLLASRPTPEQILAVAPSAELQSRVNELLRRSQDGGLSATEAAELE